MVEFNKIAMYVKLCTNGSEYESTDCNEASQEELINNKCFNFNHAKSS